jgi:hypothetical protein
LFEPGKGTAQTARAIVFGEISDCRTQTIYPKQRPHRPPMHGRCAPDNIQERQFWQEKKFCIKRFNAVICLRCADMPKRGSFMVTILPGAVIPQPSDTIEENV